MNRENGNFQVNWDDYETVLAVARSERIPAAAATLNVTVSTLFRRLERIETALAGPIFTRVNGVYSPNEIGGEIVRAAERIEQEVAQVERNLLGYDQQLSGKVTIAASEVLAPFFLAKHVQTIAAAHPKLRMQVKSGNHVVSLANGDADLAIRPLRPVDEQLYGRKLTDIRWAIYGGSQTNDPNEGQAVGFAGDALSEKTMALQLKRLQTDNMQLFSNSLILTASMTANSAARCVIPLLLGEQWPGLTRLSDPFEHEFGELWIVCHKDLRRNARVRVVFDHLIAAAKSDRKLFQGE